MESTIIDVGEIKIENPDPMTDDIVIKKEIDCEKIANETVVLELVPAFTATHEVRDENNHSLSNAQDSYGRVVVKSESNSDVLQNSDETNIFNNSNIVIKCEDIKKENEEISVTNVPNTAILTGLVIKKEDGNNFANNIVSVKTEDIYDGFKIEIKEEENETMLISSTSNIVKDLIIKQEFKSEKIDISNTDCDDSIVMKENQTDKEITTNHVNNDDVLETPVVKKTGGSNEGNSGENDTSPDDETCAVEDNTPKRFRVDRSAIESVSKENQATELQSLEGISVYDQQTLEAGIRQQVEQELAAPGDTEPADRLETGDSETEMERQIRMGEMTPFGTTLNMATTPPIKTRDGLSEIEKYLQKQLELDRKKKKNVKNGSIKDAIKKVNENVKQKVVDKKDLNKRKSVNKDSGQKKKKEVLGTKSEDFVPCTEKPGPVPGETSSTCLEEASGSEYCPSDTDFINTSEDEKPLRSKEKTTPSSGKKRKLKPEKPYKIPEDWASDDSDWEYSDEEGNVSKNKRSKKELDDGDVDAFNRRIRHWEYEKRKSGDENAEKFHSFDGDFKIPTEIWNKLYKSGAKGANAGCRYQVHANGGSEKTKIAVTVVEEVVTRVGETSVNAELERLRSLVASLQQRNAMLDEQLEAKTDELEQYQRRKNLRVFGVEEFANEDTDRVVKTLFREELGLELSTGNTCWCFRVGEQHGLAAKGIKRHRTILVRFSSFEDRQKVYKARYALKGTGIVIKEDLTKARQKVLKAAVSRFGVRRVWTFEGRVLFKHPDGSKGVATKLTDIIPLK